MEEINRFKSMKSYCVVQTLEFAAKPGIRRDELVFSGSGMVAWISGGLGLA